MDMIFKVNVGIGTGTIINSLIALVIIVGITSGIKVWQAVRTSPVKMLRTE
jgi:hypothetical protein